MCKKLINFAFKRIIGIETHMTRIKRITPFFLRTQYKSKTEAPLYIRIQDKARGIDLKLYTDIRVNVQEWLKACNDYASFSDHRSRHQELHQKLWKIECLVNDYVSEGVFDKDKLSLEILKISDSSKYARKSLLNAEVEDAMQELERVQSEYRAAEDAKQEAIRSNIWNFIERFCREIESGDRRNRAERYTEGSVKSWKSFKSLYDRFDPTHKYKWNEIDRKFANKFASFLEDHYNVTSQNKHIGNMKALINFSYEDELHENQRASKFFQKKREKVGDKSTDVWLTDNELDALYAMKIDDERDAKVRDVFLVGCYTCQRVSDYKAIPRDAIRHTEKGTLVINLVQQKTGAPVCIPVIGSNLKAILEKYDYNLPTVSDQFLNKRIKIILKDLSDYVPSLKKSVAVIQKHGRGGVMLESENSKKDGTGRVLKPRYECVTTHTARRTGITRLYNTGLFHDYELMAISGHKDVKVFKDYIKLSAEEMADRISEIAQKKTDL